MTLKRFENRLNKDIKKFNVLNPVWDNEKKDGLNVFEMIDMLNHLHEENEHLRHQLITLDGLYVSDKEDMSDCWRLDLFSDEEKEVIAYLQAYHQGNVNEIRK